jgi:hypothetical protein
VWIVSQDETLIINADTMQGISRTDGIITIWHDEKVRNVLGEYSSPEMAYTVMKHIIGAKNGVKTLPVFLMPNDKETMG